MVRFQKISQNGLMRVPFPVPLNVAHTRHRTYVRTHEGVLGAVKCIVALLTSEQILWGLFPCNKRCSTTLITFSLLLAQSGVSCRIHQFIMWAALIFSYHACTQCTRCCRVSACCFAASSLMTANIDNRPMLQKKNVPDSSLRNSQLKPFKDSGCW